MREHYPYDYAIIRVVPRVEREEFVNVGVIVSCPARGFLEARIALDVPRLLALDATLDVATVQAHLEAIPTLCTGGAPAGPLGHLAQRARFHWLVAPRSTIIQISPVHTGVCTHPETVLTHLLATMVHPVSAALPAAETGGGGRSAAQAGRAEGEHRKGQVVCHHSSTGSGSRRLAAKGSRKTN